VTAAAAALAEAKAMIVSQRHPGAFVVGADQILECDDEWFDKATNYDDAVKTLKALRNRTHRLVSAVVVVLDGVQVWQDVETASLTMRPFTDRFLRNYMDEIGSDIFETVGGYDERRFFAEDVQFLLDLRRIGRRRGQRLIRLRTVKALASCRKFDTFGDWHYFTDLFRLMPLVLRSPSATNQFAKDYWYGDQRPPGPGA